MDVKDIRIIKSEKTPEIPSEITSFGKLFTDHIFVMDWEEGKGWFDPRIIPFDNLCYSPATSIFHYGQGIFEGLKAYRDENDNIRMFRPDCNFERMNNSARRVCMPELDVDFAIAALKEFVKFQKDWIPTQPNTSLYIRPFMIATEPTLGVHAAKSYQYIVILSPSGPYYSKGLAPVDIMVEKDYVRAVRGGLGEAKTMANYAASLLAGVEAERKGYSQVLWLDGIERKYIEEVGAMNIMFKINGTVVTPMLNGSILPGVTRRSIIQILKDMNVPVEERRISIDELVEAGENGTLEEIFGTGTAAVISPVQKLNYDGKDIVAKTPYDDNSLSIKLYNYLTGIQYGHVEDKHGWVFPVE